jgi:phosphate acetyltransferase
LEDFLSKIKNRAKNEKKNIILPESKDKRIIEASKKVLEEEIANLTLFGDEQEIKGLLKGFNSDSLKIIEPNDKFRKKIAKKLHESKGKMGITLEKSEELMKDDLNLSAALVECGEADAMVAGAVNSTTNVLRAAFKIVRTAPNVTFASSFFVMVVSNKRIGENGVIIFADCGVNACPNEEQLAEIAISSAKSFREFIETEPKIALLSYSTHGSARGECVEKVINATNIAKKKDPSLIIDGELQLDSAIVPEICESKAPKSPIKGEANVLIFPNLDSGNIGYKLVQRFCDAKAYGPITQGLAKPINDLSRGSNIEDIVGVIAISAVQAQNV